MLGNESLGFRNELCLSAKDTNLPEQITGELWRQAPQKEQKLWGKVYVLESVLHLLMGATDSSIIHSDTKKVLVIG